MKLGKLSAAVAGLLSMGQTHPVIRYDYFRGIGPKQKSIMSLSMHRGRSKYMPHQGEKEKARRVK